MATLSAGLDTWTGGGGPALLGRLQLGTSNTRRPFQRTAWYAGRAELVGGGMVDAHEASVTLRHRTGLGLAASAAGSAAVGWLEGSVPLSIRRAPRRADLLAVVEPTVRTGRTSSALGLRLRTGVGMSARRVSARLELDGTAWAGSALPPVGRAALWANIAPSLVFAVQPSASLVVTGAGPEVPVAGLPRGQVAIGRLATVATLELDRTWTCVGSASVEYGPAYIRRTVLGGIQVRLGQIRSGGCWAIPAGPVVFRLEAPDARQVELLASFNDWDPVSLRRMGRVWEVRVHVQPGTHSYAYRVDGEVVPPPDAHETRPDGFGGLNGVIRVVADRHEVCD